MSAKIHAFPTRASDEHLLFEHPDGMGAIEYGGGILIVTNDLDATATRVLIGPAGLRDLAARLRVLADLIDGGAR
ncbi:hypothetical protein [Thauera chlorobenzoica]|uniref:Uncharacterized protein n=1 Tax=Thauera chlorobenzoica TaxID=96773 RepID=A0A1H5U8Z3_9RHOO|nr:hypothetical protein [Thauera chlorobenzoica]APR03796.1 hypothetical protein Tchl_0933 [Thauera chlorobenzoica]SEF71582.1 hypothetical protein SAMN05216242_104122 [Thauera chlorobenzoica]